MQVSSVSQSERTQYSVVKLHGEAAQGSSTQVWLTQSVPPGQERPGAEQLSSKQ